MNNRTSFVAILVVTLSIGCAGRMPNPVMIRQYGDEERSCQALEREMLFIDDEIARLIPQTNKAVANTILGVTGFFVIIPLFFMDLSKAEQIEINAYRRRYNQLLIIAGDKQCETERTEIPAFDQPKKNTAGKNEG
ncbi:MAG: hypothetical protein IID41_16980 [Planctomycetes bacterium]|nr:hypothetical protein [Planctomycetota bacterium]